jgi:hypothetical protein
MGSGVDDCGLLRFTVGLLRASRAEVRLAITIGDEISDESADSRLLAMGIFASILDNQGQYTEAESSMIYS